MLGKKKFWPEVLATDTPHLLSLAFAARILSHTGHRCR